MKHFSIVLLIALAGATAGYYFRVHSGVSAAEPPASVDSLFAPWNRTDWDDYLWPTDASTVRTSCFAEFRATHFHAGIDISTNNQRGYKVFASRAGYLASLTFEPFGYGWYLVVRHADGFYTAYAHLQGFPEKILRAYRARLVEQGKSFGEARWPADAVPVTRGEVIAYTGDTGAGPPHLHFEVRDSSFNPVNPGLSPKLRPVDSLPPVPSQICFMPLDAASSVNGSFRPVVLPLTRNGAGEYGLKDEPLLRGRVGLLLRAHDRAEGAEDYPTPYAISVRVDGRQFFSSVFDGIQNDLGWHIRIDRDHSMMLGRKGEFRKLYREEGNELAVYHPRQQDGGVLTASRLGSGRRKIGLLAKDISGNAAKITFHARLAEDLPISAAVNDRGTIDVAVTRPAATAMVRLAGSANGSSWNELATGTVRGRNGVSLSAPVPIPRFLRLTPFDSAGFPSLPLYLSHGGGNSASVTVKRSIDFDNVVYTVSSGVAMSRPPEGTMASAGRNVSGRAVALSPSEYRLIFVPWQGYSGRAVISITAFPGGVKIERSDELDATLITAAEGGTLASGDGEFRLQFKRDDVYRSMLFEVRRTGEHQYAVVPNDIPLAGKPRLSFTGRDLPVRAFVRPVTPANGIRLSGLVREGDVVCCSLARFAGEFALIADSQPPVLSVSLGGRGRMAAVISVRDSLSGVQAQSVIARIDGSVVPLEFSEHVKAFFIPSDVYRSSHGKRLEVEATDNAGNVGRRSIDLSPSRHGKQESPSKKEIPHRKRRKR